MAHARDASSSRQRIACGARAFVALATAVLLGSLLAPSAGATPPPPPPVEYPYYDLPSVSVEVHGSYTEHYEAPTTHDTEDVDFHFDLERSYSDVEWWSSTSPPSTGSQLGFAMRPSDDHIDAMGTYRSKSGTVEGQIECLYSQTTSELESPAESPFSGLIEMRPNPESAGAMSVKFTYPLAGNFVTAGGEECEFVKAVGTTGTSEQEGEYLLALEPLDFYSVDSTSGAAEQTFKFPHSFSATVGHDTVDLSDETIVKVNRLPPLPPTGSGGPPEVRGPSTPITPPGPSPKPPTIPEPEVGSEPPAITGGGGPPKLNTGITAKCPARVSACKVTGIVEAELPISRRATVSRAETSRASRGKRIRRVVLGRASFALAGGAQKKVTIALSKAGIAFLRSHPGVRAKIAVTVSAPGWQSVSRSRTARLRLPARHGHRKR